MKKPSGKILGLVVFSLTLLLPNPADAAWFGLDTVGTAFFYAITGWILQMLGAILAFIMGLFQWLLSFSVGFYNVKVVDAGWSVMRDFANMFFIVALIIMAFGTIFSLSKYDFRNLIGRFLFAAVIMNFSLALSRLFLQFSDVVSNVFLTALGDVAGQLGQGLHLTKLVPGADTGALTELNSVFKA